MSDIALREYKQAREAQLSRTEARRIRANVDGARGSIPAGRRWPFELLQNAHDPGPRPGRSDVRLSLACDGSRFSFEHDGSPFSSKELAALLSGGSSKDFDSEETTGRFGTGFLVTHVLSYKILLTGCVYSCYFPPGLPYYGVQQVAPVVAEEEHRIVVVTVYTFYFQEGEN